MRNKNSDYDETKFFDFEKFDDDDPYERGFADKLYDDYEADEPEEDDFYQFPEEPEPRQNTYPIRQPRKANPHQQVYTPKKRNQFQQEYIPYAQDRYDARYDYEYGDEYAEPDDPRERACPPRRPRAVPRSARQNYEPERPKKPKKKHHFFGFLLKLLLALVVLLLLVILVLHLMAKQPTGNENLGAHLEESCTILLAGTDESGDRTDTIMLLNVNKATGKVSLMSIPRDTKVNSTYTPHKINISYGVNGKGEEGMDSLMDYVSDCIGFRPDGYILLELDVFVDLVNLLGGVDFNVPMDMFYEDPSQDLFIDLKEGLQSLNGEEAMELVRYRYGYSDADIGRVSVQRDFMSSAMDQWISWKNIWKAPAAFAMLRAKSTTDLSVGNFVWIAEALLSCGTDDMYMTTVPFYFSGEYLIIDAGENYLNTINTYFNPYSENVSWDDLYIAY